MTATEIVNAITHHPHRDEIEFVQNFYHPDLDRPDKTFGEIGEPWQYEIFLFPYFDDRISRIYRECPRDWDKTGLTAACALSKIIFRDNIIIRIFGADRDQAAIIFDAIQRRILFHHPELERSGITAGKLEISCKQSNSILTVEPADDAGVFGLHQDEAVFEELHVWHKAAHRKLLEAIETKMRTRIVINTNPGANKKGLCWDQRKLYKKKFEAGSKAVYFYTAEETPFLPSWLNEPEVRDRVNVPPGVFRRLHLCKWGEGGDVFTDAQIKACINHAVSYVSEWHGGHTAGGFDMGLTRDWAAFAVVANIDGIIKLVHKKVWIPPGGGAQIQFDDVEEYLIKMIPLLNIYSFGVERWQMAGTTQKLQKMFPSRNIIDWVPSANSVVEISKNLWDIVNTNKFEMPNDPDFHSELLGLEAEESKSKDKTAFKLVFKREKGDCGHGDVTRAVAIACNLAIGMPSRNFGTILKGVHAATPQSKSWSSGMASAGGNKDTNPFASHGSNIKRDMDEW